MYFVSTVNTNSKSSTINRINVTLITVSYEVLCSKVSAIYSLLSHFLFLQTNPSARLLTSQGISFHLSWFLCPGAEYSSMQSSIPLPSFGSPLFQFWYLKVLPSFHLNELPSLIPPIQVWWSTVGSWEKCHRYAFSW